MGRKKVARTEDEWRAYHAKRQREYYAKNRAKLAARKMELYYERKAKDKGV